MTTCTAGAEEGRDGTVASLQGILRSLRLRGMAEDLPEVLEESARDGWGQLDLVRELFLREATRKRQRRYERNLKASGLSESYGLEHFDFKLAAEHGADPGVVRDLTECEFVCSGRNVILAGGVGTGKSFLARTLGLEALKRGYKVFSYNTAKLVDQLYLKRNSFHFGKLYGAIRDVPLLILDDLGYLPYSPEKVEFLFSLVVDRHELERGSIIVTSNTDVDDWWQFFPSKPMGMAFSDRLLEGAQGIRFVGESIRPKRARRGPPKPPRSGNGRKPKVNDSPPD